MSTRTDTYYGKGYRRPRYSRRRRSGKSQAEIKYVDNDLSIQGSPDSPYNGMPIPGSTALLFLLNNIQQGTGQFNRVGLLTVQKYLQIRAQMKYFSTTYPGAIVGPYPTVKTRLIAFYDKQPNGTVFNDVSLLLQDLDANGDPTTNVLSNFNRSNSHRFVIIWDKFINLTEPTVSWAPVGTETAMVDEYIRISKALNSQYLNNESPLPVNPNFFFPQSGAFYLLYFPESNPAIGMNITGITRLAYNEKF